MFSYYIELYHKVMLTINVLGMYNHIAHIHKAKLKKFKKI